MVGAPQAAGRGQGAGWVGPVSGLRAGCVPRPPGVHRPSQPPDAFVWTQVFLALGSSLSTPAGVSVPGR